MSEPAERRAQPVALTIAGSDSSAGAGIQADLKTFSAFGVYGLTAVTCVVAETPGKVARLEPLPAEIVREQIEVLAGAFPIAAIKTGLLCTAEIVESVARLIVDLSRRQHIALVVDPVMIATSGDRLLEPSAVAAYAKELFPEATLITPNLHEASHLLDRLVNDRATMEAGARDLASRFGTNVLIKGGHLNGDQAIDLLCAGGSIHEFSSEFVPGVKTHGTGCTYSAAITAGLACGYFLEDAIARAKKFVTAAIREHLTWGSVQALNHQVRAR